MTIEKKTMFRRVFDALGEARLQRAQRAHEAFVQAREIERAERGRAFRSR
jgi:hypothetical protein